MHAREFGVAREGVCWRGVRRPVRELAAVADLLPEHLHRAAAIYYSRRTCRPVWCARSQSSHPSQPRVRRVRFMACAKRRAAQPQRRCDGTDDASSNNHYRGLTRSVNPSKMQRLGVLSCPGDQVSKLFSFTRSSLIISVKWETTLHDCRNCSQPAVSILHPTM